MLLQYPRTDKPLDCIFLIKFVTVLIGDDIAETKTRKQIEEKSVFAGANKSENPICEKL